MKRDINKYSKARNLRSQGISIRTIAKTLMISTSTASIWCKDVILSDEQQRVLEKRGQHIEILQKFAKTRHENKIKNDQTVFINSQKEIAKLSETELFLIGLALYWAEGFKNNKEHRVGFCNSDPRMVSFIMKWFRHSLKIAESDFTLRVEFNISQKDRKEEIETYWSEIAKIPRNQFNSPYLQKTNQIKHYPDRTTYYGLLRIRIRKSSQLLVKIRGWIEGLSQQDS